MTRAELHELGYIVPIATVPSILQHGILSHRRAEGVAHQSIALQEVQDRRARVVVPNGRALHEYVNLYICPRNPMLFKRKDDHDQLCVLRVSPDVLDLPDVVVTDVNAARGYVRFRPAPDGLEIVNRERTFATYWTHQDERDEHHHVGQKQAEVLVPERVGDQYVTGAYVSNGLSQQRLLASAPNLLITVNADLFFQ
jgi:hypothetical protein